MNEVGFIIGNGQSRLKYQDLNIFAQEGLVFGCNALFRDYTPDLLVAVDTKMIEEILQSGYTGECLYVGRGTRAFFLNKTHPENLQGMKNSVIAGRGFAAGPSALWLMLQFHPHIKIVNLVGFDLYGIGTKINNVYAGTDNYQPVNANATVFRNWVGQLKCIFEENPGVSFYRVGNSEDSIPREWVGITNIHFVEDWVVGREHE